MGNLSDERTQIPLNFRSTFRNLFMKFTHTHTRLFQEAQKQKLCLWENFPKRQTTFPNYPHSTYILLFTYLSHDFLYRSFHRLVDPISKFIDSLTHTHTHTNCMLHDVVDASHVCFKKKKNLVSQSDTNFSLTFWSPEILFD